MKFQINNKKVHASDSGQGIDYQKFKKAWNGLIELEKSENIESSDYIDNLLDILNDLFRIF